jgi:Na+/glutamate symporter
LFSVCVISIVVSPDSVVRWLVVIFGGVDLIPVVGVVVCLDSVGPWIVVFLAVDLVVVVSISVVFCIVVGTVVLSIACGVDPDHVVEVPGVDRDVGSAIKDPQYYNILNQC